VLKLKSLVGLFTVNKIYGQDDRLLTQEKMVSIAIEHLHEQVKGEAIDRSSMKAIADRVNGFYADSAESVKQPTRDAFR
jgi:hypothetical protein